ncbi:MAG: hypothetical protein Q6359_10870, partial [Candidatus Brocadiales bacterium]|nr:hypothetical protein [Candidatus Brocadiales bacterium]
VYAVSTVLGGILISSGAGSLLSGRLVNWRKDILKYVLPILCLIIILYFITLSFVVYSLLKLNLLARIITGILILAPLGLLMGIPFPIGIRWLEERAGGLIPWAWAVNGCTSVLASILAMMLALSIGFTGVILFAAIAYLLAMVFFLVAR